MSQGQINQYVDYSIGTGGDSGTNDPKSIQPILNGEDVVGADPGVGYGGTDNRTAENLRQRFETVRGLLDDTLYLRDADRDLMLGGPGTVAWPGSTTAAQTGIPTLSDVLYIVPALTPGAAQVSPIPPVASNFGTLTLAKTGGGNGLVITSRRRSYAGGDKINATVVPGVALTVVVSDSPQRTIVITCPAGTTLNAAIAAINALTADTPATQLVTATLAGGASGTLDTLLVTQAKQFITGNYDGEGHTLTPAGLAAFFVANPTSALAEGDTLCVQYANMNDAGLGGRRQSLPENSNTTIPAGSYFNSRVSPNKLVNAIPICKVINGELVFINGKQVPAGETAFDFGHLAAATTAKLGSVKLSVVSGTPTAPIVYNPDVNGALTVAASGGNAAGVTSTGNGTGAGGSFKGGATGPGLVTQEVANSSAPQIELKNSAGQIRGLFDHNGFRGGRVTEFEEDWSFVQALGAGTFTTPSGKFTATANVLAGIISDPLVSYPGSCLELVVTTASGDLAWFNSTTPLLFSRFSGLSFVIEFEAFMSSIRANCEQFLGFSTNPALFHTAGGGSYMWLSSNGGGTWQCQTFDGTTLHSTDSTVAPVGSVPQRFRIEFQGSASPLGATTVIFSIDEVRHTMTANLDITAPYYFGGQLVNTAVTAGGVDMFVGPIRASWNRFLTPPAL